MLFNKRRTGLYLIGFIFFGGGGGALANNNVAASDNSEDGEDQRARSKLVASVNLMMPQYNSILPGCVELLTPTVRGILFQC